MAPLPRCPRTGGFRLRPYLSNTLNGGGDTPIARWQERCKDTQRFTMGTMFKRWEAPRSRFGDFVVVSFLVVQYLDGVFTYLGMKIWGPGIEANPLISSAITVAGVT